MTGPETPLFVVVRTDGDLMTGHLMTGHLTSSPRGTGPFGNYDVAEALGQTLIERWQTDERTPPTATVVRVEADLPGVVVGEI